MKRLCLMLLLILLASSAGAVEVAGVQVATQVQESGRTLQLNGYGIRSKFFVKVYVGSLYATRLLTTPEQVYADPGDKLLRMQFVHSRVSREKIVAAFAEGLASNAPQVAETAAARQFLTFFTSDLLAGETVDLVLAADGTVTVRHDGRQLGRLHSPALAAGILAIYLGEHPADAALKRGLLGER